jgi:streptomycin 6-kinase
MIDFPIEAKNNIIRTQGDYGQTFLDNLSLKFSKYIEKWKLLEYKFLAHSTNLIYACKSEIYGDVIIKAGVPEDERLLTEISTTKFYSKKPHTCKLYDYSLEDGFLMFERLTPGNTLKDDIKDPVERAGIFLDIFKHYHLPCEDTTTYPTYISLIEAFDNLVSDTNFAKYKEIKKTLYYDINNDYSKKYLLHGDLHFSNILSHGNSFKVIDPHGIIGDPLFDISRFLSNELSDSMREKRLFNHDIVVHISKSLEKPISILYALLFIDVAHHASYHLGNPITQDRYEFNLSRCEIAYNLYLSAS